MLFFCVLRILASRAYFGLRLPFLSRSFILFFFQKGWTRSCLRACISSAIGSFRLTPCCSGVWGWGLGNGRTKSLRRGCVECFNFCSWCAVLPWRALFRWRLSFKLYSYLHSLRQKGPNWVVFISAYFVRDVDVLFNPLLCLSFCAKMRLKLSETIRFGWRLCPVVLFCRAGF